MLQLRHFLTERFFRCESWWATTPGGDRLSPSPFPGVFFLKENAEKNALSVIDRHSQRETVSAYQLQGLLAERQGKTIEEVIGGQAELDLTLKGAHE